MEWRIPRWVSRVSVEFRPEGVGAVAGGRLRGRLWLSVPAGPSALLSDPAAFSEAVEGALDAWLSPGSGPGYYVASSILLGLLALALGELASRGVLGAYAAALLWVAAAAVEGVRALLSKRGQVSGAAWVEGLVRAAAEVAAACRSSGRCRGVYPLLGSIFEYKVEGGEGSVTVSMWRRKPYA